ncbi:MAG: SMI1/KNR4 family protein [Ruminococcus sp.]|nr:SMI1/KNR4 family protein [Ruminococcus sp.]
MYNFNTPKTLQECLERLKKGCEMLYDEYEYPEDYSQFNPPATEERIQAMEKRIGFALPREYREFLKFSNGAKIMGNSATIYGLDWIGASDPMVPAGYLTIGEVIGDGERIALSEADGKIYSCYNGRISLWHFEDRMFEMLSECEGLIEDIQDDMEREERRKSGITEDQELAEIYAQIMAERKRIDEEKKQKE